MSLRPLLPRRRLLATSLCSLLLACTDAELGDSTADARVAQTSADAGRDGAPPIDRDTSLERPSVPDSSMLLPVGTDDDGGTPAGAVLPAWAEPLLGHFAVRAYTLKEDSFGVRTRAEDISVAHFSFDPATGLTVSTKLCSSLAQNDFASITLTDPRQVPPRVETVLLNEKDQRWSTRAMAPLAIGFTERAPQPCAGIPGMMVATFPYQTWLGASECRCGAEGDPPTKSDCRTLDPDNDGKPGFTFRFVPSVPPFGPANIFAVSRSTTHYTNGVVASDGNEHSANMTGGEEVYQLGCEPDGCMLPTSLGKYCPDSYNVARLVRRELSANSTELERCEDLLQNLAAVFPPAPPRSTESCSVP